MATVALVTGGSRGIGRAAAIRLAADFDVVALTYRSAADEAASAADVIVAAGATAIVVQCDLADPAAASELVEQVQHDVGGIDAVVNNAGGAAHRAFADLELELWQQTMSVNATAPFCIMQAAARVMAARGGGSIVNIGSPAGRTGGLLGAHYSAAKGALIGLTMQAAKELAPQGIRVNLVEPALIATELVLDLIKDNPDLSLMPPMGRRGQPEEAAEVIAFLCSAKASFVSGAVVAVGGAA